MTELRRQIGKICLAALFLALGLVLPTITGNIPQYGSMFLPMHLPVILAGFVLGPWYGLVLGAATPLLRSVFFGMPPIFPTALSMSFELAAYGFTSGFLFYLIYRKFKKINIYGNIFISLISSLIVGRLVYGLAMWILMLCNSSVQFNGTIYINGILLNAWPGILIQLVLVPSLVIILYKAKLLQPYLEPIAKKHEKVDNNKGGELSK